MARTKTTTTTSTSTTTTNKTETRRVTSLQARPGKQLTSLEEAVVRMHHGVSLKPAAALATNGVTDALSSQLLDLEVDAHIATGRSEDLPDVPVDERSPARKPVGNARSQKVADRLKRTLKK
jgi:hypothetical protein